MKTFASAIALVISVVLSSAAGIADEGKPGHDHAVISETRASEIATAEVQKLTAAKKLDAEWAGISIAKATQAGKAKDWVVQYDNPAAKDTTKKSLYVIVAPSGEVKAVNFKGIQKAHSHGSGAAHTH